MGTITTRERDLATEQELASLSKRIHDECMMALTAGRAMVDHAARAGGWLIEAKAKVRHGEWETWLEENGHAARTAQVYMRIHRRWEAILAASGGNVPESIDACLRLISEPRRIPHFDAEAEQLDESRADDGQADGDAADAESELPFYLPEPGEEVWAWTGNLDAIDIDALGGPEDLDQYDLGDLCSIIPAVADDGLWFHVETYYRDETRTISRRAAPERMLRSIIENRLPGVDLAALQWRRSNRDPLPGEHPEYRPYWSHPDDGHPELNAIEAEFHQARLGYRHGDTRPVREAFERLRDCGLWADGWPSFSDYVHGRLDTDEKILPLQYWPTCETCGNESFRYEPDDDGYARVCCECGSAVERHIPDSEMVGTN